MNTDFNSSDGSEEKIAKAKELLKKAVFGVLKYIGESKAPEKALFFDYKNLPKWRSVFSGLIYNEKERVLILVQELKWKGELRNVKEVSNCLNFLVKCDVFNRNGWPLFNPTYGKDSEDEREAYFFNEVEEFIESYVRSFGNQVSNHAFDALFKVFYRHFPDFPETIHKEIALLSGFELKNLETLDFEDFEIREIDPVELGIIQYLQSSKFGYYDKVELSHKIWVLDIKNIVEPDVFETDGDWGISFPDDYVHPHEIEDQILTFLRLFRGGNIGITYKMSYESIKWGVMSVGRGNGKEIFLRPESKPYIIYPDDKTDLAHNWQAFKKITNERKERYRIAVTRFNRARETESSEDQIVDVMISFENIFPSSDPKYIGTQLGISLQEYLGEIDSSYPVLKTIKTAYFARNKIVHGKDITKIQLLLIKKEEDLLIKKEGDLKNLLEIIMEWLRKSLLSKLLGE